MEHEMTIDEAAKRAEELRTRLNHGLVNTT